MFGLNEPMVQDAIAALPGFERVRVRALILRVLLVLMLMLFVLACCF